LAGLIALEEVAWNLLCEYGGSKASCGQEGEEIMNRKSDSEIKGQVLRELKWDSRNASSDIGVEVLEGIVTLTGTVNSYARKQAAQEAAHRIVGVLDVANDIDVKPAGDYTRQDGDIARAVRHVLQWDALVPDEQIQSTVSNGWVTLEGEVGLWRERKDAEQAVMRLEGVIGVVNKISITPKKVDPRELREEIEYALERRADREAERLRIEVNDGAVDLYGRVHSWQEKRAVVGSISHAPGVAQIRDHLRIDPYF
jgi:osmotically-inducible protein OsmY